MHEQMPMPTQNMGMYESMPMQMPTQNMGMPCGCNDSAPYNHMMMPYDSNFMQPSYFVPNYDIAPVMDEDMKNSTLPEWVIDSSSNPGVMGVSQEQKDMYDDHQMDDSKAYHQMSNNDYGPSDFAYGHHDMNYPSAHQMPYQTMPDYYNMNHVMPGHYNMQPYMNEHFNMPDYYMQQPMPYHMMQYPHMMNQHSQYPYSNHHSSNYKPWNY